MFGFANFLLLALFAAAVFDLIFALARGGGLRGALHGLWNTPHLLFGQQLAEWRLQLGRILFAAGLAAYEISVVFCNSMARQNWAWVQGVMSPVLEWLAFLCFGAKILFGTRYTWRELLAGGALYFIARWVYFNSQNIWWIGIVVAVLAAKDVPLAPPAAGLFCQRLCRHGGGAGTALCRDRCSGPDQRADGRFARHLRLRPPQHIRRTGVRPGIGLCPAACPKGALGGLPAGICRRRVFAGGARPAAALRCARWRWPLGWCSAACAPGTVYPVGGPAPAPVWWGLRRRSVTFCRCWSSRWDRGTMISAPHGWQSWTPCSPAASR